MKLHIVEPDPCGRISGGYVYNQRMVPDSRRHAVQLDALASDVARIELGDTAVVLADSLFLTPQRLAPFVELRRQPGVRVGVVLHAFPSFIERASNRDGLASQLPLLPTREERALLSQLDLVVAPGPYVPRLLEACNASVLCVVCPPGADPIPPREKGPRQGPLRLLSIGAVAPLKGFADGLAALSRVTSTDFQWNIVGHTGVEPEHVRDLLSSVERFGMSERVRFLGQRSREETLGEIAKSHVLFLPSYTENHPLVALEALAFQLPIVGYAVGGLPDIVRDGESGLLAPLLDVSALAERLDLVLQDDAELERLRVGAARAAQGLITWEAAAGDFEHRIVAAFSGAAPCSSGGRA